MWWVINEQIERTGRNREEKNNTDEKLQKMKEEVRKRASAGLRGEEIVVILAVTGENILPPLRRCQNVGYAITKRKYYVDVKL